MIRVGVPEGRFEGAEFGAQTGLGVGVFGELEEDEGEGYAEGVASCHYDRGQSASVMKAQGKRRHHLPRWSKHSLANSLFWTSFGLK